MTPPLAVGDKITCIEDPRHRRARRLRAATVTRLYDAGFVVEYDDRSLQWTSYFSYDHEGMRWIRGKHTKTPEGQALLVAFHLFSEGSPP